jgi:hypothetical protein
MDGWWMDMVHPQLSHKIITAFQWMVSWWVATNNDLPTPNIKPKNVSYQTG